MRRPTIIHNGSSTTTSTPASGWGTLDYHHGDRLVVEDADLLLEEFDDREEHRREKPFHKFRIQIKKPSISITTQEEDRTRRWSSNSAPSLPSTITSTASAMSSSIQESRRRRQGYSLNSERRLSDQRDLRRSSILSSLEKLARTEDNDADNKLWSSVRSSSSCTPTGHDTNARRSSSSIASHRTKAANHSNPTQSTKHTKTPRRHAVLVPVGSLSEMWTATPSISSATYDDASLKRTSTGGGRGGTAAAAAASIAPEAHGSTISTKRQERNRQQGNMTQKNHNSIKNINSDTHDHNHDNEEHDRLEHQRQQPKNHRAQRRGSITKYSFMDGESHDVAVASPAISSSSSTPFDLDNVKSGVVSTNYDSTNSLPTTTPKASRGRKQDTAAKTAKVAGLAATADLVVENEEQQDGPTVRSFSRTSRRRGSVTRYSLDDCTASIAATAVAWMVEDDVNRPVAPRQQHPQEADIDEVELKNGTSPSEPLKKTHAARRGVITKYSSEQPAYQ